MDVESSAGRRQHVLWDLVRTAHLAERRFREVFAEFGLTAAQYGVLASLADGDDVSPAELARSVLVRPQSLAGVLEALVEAGLVVREGPPGRGRRKALSLSKKGRAVFAEARPAAYRLLETETTGLDPQQTHELGSTLTTLRRHLSEAGPSSDGPHHPTPASPCEQA